MLLKHFLAGAFSSALIFATSGCGTMAAPEVQAAVAPEIAPAQMTPEYLQQLAAPIALYPDELVAQVLAASTYPTEIVEAEVANAPGSASSSRPFYGYYFRILSKQGASAAGGAKNYIVDGKMTGGFALLAYPAQYAVSGIMTFMVGSDGTIYQTNLGPNTAAIVKAIDEYNPDMQWEKVG